MFPLRREASLTLDSTSDRCKEQLPFYYHPPTKLRKVMFSLVCVILSMGVCVCLVPGPFRGWVCLVPCPFWGQVGGGWGGHTRGQVYQREWVYKRGWDGYTRR